MKRLLASLLFSIFFILNAVAQTPAQSAIPTKVRDMEGAVNQYVAGEKSLLTKESRIVSGTRLEVVNGRVEILVDTYLITATAGADFTVDYKPNFLKINSSQVPIELQTSSGHNLVLASRADVEIAKFNKQLVISAKKGRILISDLKGSQETKILNSPNVLTVADLGLVQVATARKSRKAKAADFFKRFTKEEFNIFTQYDTDLKDFVFGDNAYLNNTLVGKKSYFKYFLDTKGVYDSNIYLTANAETFAYINQTAVGFKFKQGFQNSYVYGGYKFDLLTYSEQQSANNAVYHDVHGGFKIKFPSELTVALKENYIATTSQETSEMTVRAKRTKNDLNFFTEFPLSGKLGLRANLRHINHNYLPSSLNSMDRSHLYASGGFTYLFFPETSVFVNYKYDGTDFKSVNTHDAKSHNASISIEKKLSPEIIGKIGAGFEFRKYENNFVLAPNTSGNKYDTFTFDAQVVWKPQSQSRVILIAERKNIETGLDIVNELSRFYTSTLIDLSWFHTMDKFDFNLGFGWEIAQYPEINNDAAKRRDDRYSTFRAEISWHLKTWLTAGVNYGFKNRSSNLVTTEYDGHIGGISLKSAF